mgnify:CR=1 FL=1
MSCCWLKVLLFTTQGEQASPVKSFTVKLDGHSDGPLYDNHSLKKGTYHLVFDAKAYFRTLGVHLPEPSFMDQVSLDFGIAHTDQHDHLPLQVSPWSDATYRGSSAEILGGKLAQRALLVPRIKASPNTVPT